MKTTVEIGDELARTAKAFAAREKITFRTLVERGLRLAIDEDGDRKRYRLPDASVGGQGLQPEWRDADWPRIRDGIYAGRGS